VGAAIGILGMVALAVFLAGHRRPRAAVWGLVTGVLGSTLVTAVFGIAAFAQPAIGRDYLAGPTTAAHTMYYAATQGAWLVATAFTSAAPAHLGVRDVGGGVVRAPGRLRCRVRLWERNGSGDSLAAVVRRGQTQPSRPA